MSKISLKSILKKTFKKKTKSKVKKKTIKKVKKTKIIKLKKEKKISKISKKVERKSKQKTEVQNENLRIPKNNEIKPEIKKVKKQNTEKREYKIKDYVVYPKHGVGQITEFKKINIGGIDVETYIIKFEKGWVRSYCPKLLTLERYPFKGPFRTVLEMKTELANANKRTD